MTVSYSSTANTLATMARSRATFFKRTVDYPDERANGYHVMLDTEELVTMRWEQVEGIK